jgi:hypothetical protein
MAIATGGILNSRTGEDLSPVRVTDFSKRARADWTGLISAKEPFLRRYHLGVWNS